MYIAKALLLFKYEYVRPMTASVTKFPQQKPSEQSQQVIWDRAMAFWPTVAIRYFIEGGDVNAHIHKTRREFMSVMTDKEKDALYAVYNMINGNED